MPIYEYECCGHRLERYKPMDRRYEVTCPICGGVPQLVVSKPATPTIYGENITLTVKDGDGNVIGVRKDHRRTPPFHEYHPREVIERTQWGQEVAHQEMVEEAERIRDTKPEPIDRGQVRYYPGTTVPIRPSREVCNAVSS